MFVASHSLPMDGARYSLAPVAKCVQEKLGKPVTFLKAKTGCVDGRFSHLFMGNGTLDRLRTANEKRLRIYEFSFARCHND